MSDDDESLNGPPLASSLNFLGLPYNQEEEIAVQLHQHQFETDEMPIKSDSFTGKDWLPIIDVMNNQEMMTHEYPRESESYAFFDSKQVIGTDNEATASVPAVAGYISFTDDILSEIKRVTMVAPVVSSGPRQADQWNLRFQSMRLGATQLTARHFAIALQEYEPGCDGTIWWGEFVDCPDFPTTKQLRAHQLPLYTSSGKKGLENMMAWMNELRDCSHSTYGNTVSFYSTKKRLHGINYLRFDSLNTVSVASSTFVNKKKGNLFCNGCKCIVRSGQIDETRDVDLIELFDSKWNHTAVCNYNVKQESQQVNEGEHCSDGDWILRAGIDLHSIFPHNRVCARPQCDGVGGARGRATLMEWTDYYTLELNHADFKIKWALGNDLMKIVDWLKHGDYENCPMFAKVLNGCNEYPFDNTRWLPLPWTSDGKPIFHSDKANQEAIVSYDVH
jgi:hypothetical protein